MFREHESGTCRIVSVVQTIALTLDDKRAMLRRAWALAPQEANSLLETIEAQIVEAQDRVDEDVSSAGSNSHSATANQPGSKRITDQETVRGWRELLESFRAVRQFLRNCAKYGQDAFVVYRNGTFPNPLPDPIADDIRLTIDTYGAWALLFEKEDIPT